MPAQVAERAATRPADSRRKYQVKNNIGTEFSNGSDHGLNATPDSDCNRKKGPADRRAINGLALADARDSIAEVKRGIAALRFALDALQLHVENVGALLDPLPAAVGES